MSLFCSIRLRRRYGLSMKETFLFFLFFTAFGCIFLIYSSSDESTIPTPWTLTNLTKFIQIFKSDEKNQSKKDITWRGKDGNESILNSIDISCSTDNLEKLKAFKFDLSPIQKEIEQSDDRCKYYVEKFDFRLESSSDEELNYPLAYGILAYHDFVQLMLMLSSFYEPQNEYCISIPFNAESSFRHLLNEIPHCFSNIHIIQTEETSWGNFEIIRSVHSCLVFLDQLSTQWKYYQYLSGVDLPLKTNLEMVRIFQKLNGSPIAEVSRFQGMRLKGKSLTSPPLPLFKSSMSALIPRGAADRICSNPIAFDLLHFLKGTDIPDEGLWATVLGNPNKFPLPKQWNASAILEFRKSRRTDYRKLNENECATEAVCTGGMGIARKQGWGGKCNGKMASGSCVYGVGDVSDLIKAPELVAHKFYLDTQPAAFFCILKELERRRKNPDKNFHYERYSRIPQVELANGIPFDKLTYPQLV